MLDLSKSRFYALIQAGVFPPATRHVACKRPVFDLDLQQRCLDIRHTGIGNNNQPVLFNRKYRAKAKMPRQSRQRAASDHSEMIEALRSLGLKTTPAAVQAALDDLYPDGCDGIDQGEVVRSVFLKLRSRK